MYRTVHTVCTGPYLRYICTLHQDYIQIIPSFLRHSSKQVPKSKKLGEGYLERKEVGTEKDMAFEATTFNMVFKK
jgi:hypothetical protein